MRKPVFGVSDLVQHKPACTCHRRRPEAWNFGFKKKRDCTIRVAKPNAMIGFAVTAQPICAFVFAYRQMSGFLTTLLKSETGVYMGIPIFLIFAPVYTLLVPVRGGSNARLFPGHRGGGVDTNDWCITSTHNLLVCFRAKIRKI